MVEHKKAVLTLPITAIGDVPQYAAVAFDGAVFLPGSGVMPLGVATHSATDGETVMVDVIGVTTVRVANEVEAGVWLGAIGDGYAWRRLRLAA